MPPQGEETEQPAQPEQPAETEQTSDAVAPAGPAPTPDPVEHEVIIEDQDDAAVLVGDPKPASPGLLNFLTNFFPSQPTRNQTEKPADNKDNSEKESETEKTSDTKEPESEEEESSSERTDKERSGRRATEDKDKPREPFTQSNPNKA